MDMTRSDNTTENTPTAPPTGNEQQDAAFGDGQTTTTCHVLPCNVDFTGMAPTHIYFHSVQVEPGMYASTFRGRGLLAKLDTVDDDDDALDRPSKACLLSVEENQIQIKATIDNVLQWHHEHNPKTLKYDESRSRFEMARAWIEVANALHDPLPLEEDVYATIS